MPGIEIKGRSKIANYRHGGRTGKFGGGRTNLLEELGRVEAEPSNRNRRAEISRVHGELNRGYAKGGAVRHLARGLRGRKGKEKDFKTHGRDVPTMAAAGGRIGLKHGFQALGGGIKGKPHSTREGRDDAGRRRFKRIFGEDWSKGPGSRRMGRPGRGKDFKTHGRDVTTMAAKGGRIGLKKGGSDKNWIQKATASIKKRGTKGKCTPITKPGCTGRAKALAKTFKKMAAKRKS